MTAFVAAIDVIFADRNIGEDAIWRSGGAGVGVPVRVIRKSPDRIVNFGDSRAILPIIMIDVRKVEVATPATGDAFEIAGDLFEIVASPTIDSLGLVWTCEADRQA